MQIPSAFVAVAAAQKKVKNFNLQVGTTFRLPFRLVAVFPSAAIFCSITKYICTSILLYLKVQFVRQFRLVHFNFNMFYFIFHILIIS